MAIANAVVEQQVKAFCKRIAADPLLVQGAGGNVSWKDGDTIWVKASGTWLSEAESKQIFVPLRLAPILAAITEQEFSVNPLVEGNSSLRPSIETLLHALMPHRVVAHLHAVEILTHLVQVGAEEKIRELIGDEVKWVYVDYYKPGAILASAVSKKLIKSGEADVVFLGNHGVVMGGKSVEEVASMLSALISRMKTEVPCAINKSNHEIVHEEDFLALGYIPCPDHSINQLATNHDFSYRLYESWALYPDHVVFLGSEAAILDSRSDLSKLNEIIANDPPFIFALGSCVFQKKKVTAAQKAQLRCYYDVISRVAPDADLKVLSNNQIFELLDWDAEKYRQKLI